MENKDDKFIGSSFTIKYRRFLTSQEAAEFLRISTPTLMNLTSNGRIPYYKFGRSNRYLLSELESYLMSQPRGERHEYKV